MENFTPGEIWTTILAIASAFVLLSNAAEKIAKAVRAAKAPNEKQDERIKALETWKESVDRNLINDNDRLSSIEASDRCIQHALLALLDHSIDGNNIKQMEEAKKELQDHLINR